MTYKMLISAGLIGGALLLVKYMLGRARTDSILSELDPAESKKRAEEYAAELAKAEEEVRNAKIEYNNSRRALDDKSDTEG